MKVQPSENSDLIYIINSEEDLVEFQAQQEDEVLQISMHAAMGTGATKNTFIVNIQLSNITTTTLIHSGSTSTFISPEIAEKLPDKATPCKKRKVPVASGGILWSQFIYQDCSYSIQGEKFQDDVLQLKGYDIILRADWLRK